MSFFSEGKVFLEINRPLTFFDPAPIFRANSVRFRIIPVVAEEVTSEGLAFEARFLGRSVQII